MIEWMDKFFFEIVFLSVFGLPFVIAGCACLVWEVKDRRLKANPHRMTTREMERFNRERSEK
jgi:hypothetical protein